MNSSSRYVPSHEKWIKYYDKVGVSEHPHYFHSKLGHSNKTNTEKIKSKNETPSTSELKVEFVSPALQVVEQATSEMKREQVGIKRKCSTAKLQSSKKKTKKRFKINDDGNQF